MESVRVFWKLNRTDLFFQKLSNQSEPKRVQAYKKLRNALKKISVLSLGSVHIFSEPNRDRDRFEKLQTEPIPSLICSAEHCRSVSSMKCIKYS